MRLDYKDSGGEDHTVLQCHVTISLYMQIFKVSCGTLCTSCGRRLSRQGSDAAKGGTDECLVLPPKLLCHPVPPFRCNNWLFCLWKTCDTEQNMTTQCTHETIAERTMLGTWVLDEVRLAVQKGNKIFKVHEVMNITSPSTIHKRAKADNLHNTLKLA